jgi:hypothetical protein
METHAETAVPSEPVVDQSNQGDTSQAHMEPSLEPAAAPALHEFVPVILPPPPMNEAPAAMDASFHQPNSDAPADAQGQTTIHETATNASGQLDDSVEAREVRKRRQRWGPPANAPQDAAGTDGPAKKKRRSRWETEEVTTVGALLPSFPKEITLPGGLRVSCLPACRSQCTSTASYPEPHWWLCCCDRTAAAGAGSFWCSNLLAHQSIGSSL